MGVNLNAVHERFNGNVEMALEIVKAAGYVVLKQKSYYRAQERQRVAEARAEWEKECAEHSRAWAISCLDEQRRLADRLTFVYGVARSFGASVEDLAGDKPPTGEARCTATDGDGQRCIQARGHNKGKADIPENHTFALQKIRRLSPPEEPRGKGVLDEPWVD